MKKLSGDWRILVWASGAALAVIVVGAFFAPAREDTDITPSSDNSGSHGAKAAFLLLQQLGYQAERWDREAKDLSDADAPHTTLVLAGAYPGDVAKERPGIENFLRHGGRVLATGALSAGMLPESHIAAPNRVYTELCYTTPQGLSPMARAGRIAMDAPIRWNPDDVNLHVDQRCGDDAVVVHYPVGKGEVVWWSSAAPLSNRGLKQDASLRLFLASIGGPDRRVLFDEYIHGARPDLWATTAGTPVRALEWQLAAVAILLVLSFGRRSGPLRIPVEVPRTSPLEFAQSMGNLYRQAGAVSVATGAAERRLMEFLQHEGGIPRETLRSTPEAIAEAVSQRFQYVPASFLNDLKTARQSEYPKLTARSGLELVKRIDHHIATLAAIVRHSKPAGVNGEAGV
ncbi:MAG: DUF4350 domain-containing protein [Acidobacteriaceae bacterium]|nr:DUF4350 domain-containing protein [Acidobacteriaceae bacterium]